MRVRSYAGGPSGRSCFAVISCVLALGFAHGQTSSIPTPAPIPPPSSTIRSGYDPNAANLPLGMEREDLSLRMRREIARRDEMKKRMAQNAARLLQLTTELRADLDTREPTEADGKRLDEIARLAHAVRDAMRQ